jgi:hypothetical protein
MKKVLAVLVVLAMVSGCAAINSFLCHPTDTQTEAANVGLSLVQAALIAATFYSEGNELVTALSTQAAPVFRQVVQGYCVTQAQWDSAVTVVEQAQPSTKTFTVNHSALALLKAVRW